MTSPTLLRATIRPGFLVGPWPWRGLAYTLSTAVVAGALWLVLACPVTAIWGAVSELRRGTDHLLAATALGLFGVGVLAVGGPPLAVGLGHLERWRLRLVDDRPAPSGRRGRLYLDPATWQAFGYLSVMSVLTPLAPGVLFLVGLLVATLLAAPLAVANGGLLEIGRFAVTTQGAAIGLTAVGVLLVPVLLYLSTVFSGAQAALARSLLTGEPDPAAAQLVEVARSRARLVDAFDAERHRIERDLHDGAQQRLVNLTMQLGLAQLDLLPDSPAAAAVAAAHDQAKAVMVELRDLIRGINPRTLTELGLAAAVDELAATSAIPVTVRIDGGRLPPAVETVAYYAVAEALTNVAKHSGAGEAAIEVRRVGDTLTVEVRDDGRGGADPRAGSGLTGLADRVAAAGGRLLLSSPAGGPTTVRIELPCGS